MIIRIADSETTGFDDPKATEVAYLTLDADKFPLLEVTETFEQRFNPEKQISWGAAAVTHILNDDLKDEPLWGEYIFPKTDYLIGHNIDYDWKVFREPDCKRIDTLALSRWLFPDMDSHTQTAMLYMFMGTEARPLLKEAHSALCDVKNNKRLLEFLIQAVNEKNEKEGFPCIESIEDLWETSQIARVPTVVGFGKFKGRPFTDIDKGYLKWWLGCDTPPDEWNMIALRQAGLVK